MDLQTLPHGETYADTYGAWLDIFRDVAMSEEPIVVKYPPACWAPLFLYLGADVVEPREEFPCDTWIFFPVETYDAAKKDGRQREYVEHICALRPELVDALWKSDCQWSTRGRDHTYRSSFVVANYSALHRPELIEFMHDVDAYEKPTGVTCAVVTNCSADKPYPAKLHRAIRAILPNDDWQLLIATGVLGVVPEEMWGEMPEYDSGLPHFWRCLERWEEFLGRNHYDRIVVYTEFYSRAVTRALSRVTGRTRVDWVTPCGPFKDYLDLASPKWLNPLREKVMP